MFYCTSYTHSKTLNCAIDLWYLIEFYDLLWSFAILSFKWSVNQFSKYCIMWNLSVLCLWFAFSQSLQVLCLGVGWIALLPSPHWLRSTPTLVEVKTICFNCPNPSTRSWSVWSQIRPTIYFLEYCYAGVALHYDQSVALCVCVFVFNIIW